MPQKIVEIGGIGRVVVAKRRGTRNLRLAIRPDGTVRVGIPAWAPYSAGIEFAKKRIKWINTHLANNQPLVLIDGQRIGKSHRLNFVHEPTAANIRTRVASNLISIRGPHRASTPRAQRAAQTACERALKKEAETLLVNRLYQLASTHGFKVGGVKIKRLTSRWGSCTDKKQITLNYYLVQLPWHLIDYVIIHELAHTRYLDHSGDFWDAVENILPEARSFRREIKTYRPVLTPV